MNMGDSGIYDLILHKRDISFTVSDFHHWLHKGGYHFVGYTMPGNLVALSLNAGIDDKRLYKYLSKRYLPAQQGIYELVSGDIHPLWAYASKVLSSEYDPMRVENVIFPLENPIGFHHAINNTKNYQKFRNGTFFVAKLAGTFIGTNIEATTPQYGGDSRKSARIVAEVKWPFTEFNNYLISTLTRKPAN